MNIRNAMVAFTELVAIALLILVGVVILPFVLLWNKIKNGQAAGVKPPDPEAIQILNDTIAVLNSGDEHEMEKLAEARADFPLGLDPFCDRTWLVNAINECGFSAIQWILSKGPDVNWEDDEGLTPLKSAIHREMPDRLKVVQALINAGADVNQPGEGIGITPLHSAAILGDLETVQALVAAGADPSIYCTDTMPKNAEGYARGQRHKKVAAYLASVRREPRS